MQLDKFEYFFLFGFLLTFQVFIYYLLKDKFFFNDFDFKKPQSVHKRPTPRIGGVILFLPVLILFYNFKDITGISGFISVCSLCFFLGLLDDIKIINNPFIRFIFLICSLLFSVIFFEIEVVSFGNNYLNYFNSFYLVSIIFTISCIFASTNGANITDGFNGSLLINFSIAILFYLICAYLEKNYLITELLISMMVLSLFLIFLNFPHGKIFMGDSGAYFCGSFLAMVAITLNKNLDISPFFIANVIIYFVFEFFFSIFRKLIEKKNPFKPDNQHLHLLLFQYLNLKKIDGANYKTSILINITNLCLILPSIFFYKDMIITKILFFGYIVIYFFCYFFLKKKLFKKL